MNDRTVIFWNKQFAKQISVVNHMNKEKDKQDKMRGGLPSTSHRGQGDRGLKRFLHRMKQINWKM